MFTRIPVAPLGLLTALLALGAWGAWGDVEWHDRPHVVLIVVDTLRADAILDPGNRYATPRIDELAGDGALFTHAFTHAPMTLPAHTALFSSRLPNDTGVVNNGQTVPAEPTLYAEWLSKLGYETRAVVGLGTLMTPPAGAGLERGFESYDQDLWHMAPGWQVRKRVNKSLALRDPERPLFLFAHFSDPHSPVGKHDEELEAEVLLNGEAVDRVVMSQLDIRSRPFELLPGRNVFEFRSETSLKISGFHVLEGGRRLQPRWEVGGTQLALKYARAVVERDADASNECQVRYWLTDWIPRREIPERYAQEVQYADHWVGEVLDRLKRDGIYDDALIVFTSDHGESLGEHGYYGHVDFLTDEQVRVPLIIKPPRGARLEELRGHTGEIVRHIDLVPTLLAWCGLPPMPGQRGVNFVESEVPAVLSETYTPQAVQTKVSLRDERYKLIYVADEERFLMYDLQRDPRERVDVFAERGQERGARLEILEDVARRGSNRAVEPLTESVLDDLEALGYAR
jgi:arylsulfatase A-like enzyme